jgi:hypothetical protein
MGFWWSIGLGREGQWYVRALQLESSGPTSRLPGSGAIDQPKSICRLNSRLQWTLKVKCSTGLVIGGACLLYGLASKQLSLALAEPRGKGFEFSQAKPAWRVRAPFWPQNKSVKPRSSGYINSNQTWANIMHVWQRLCCLTPIWPWGCRTKPPLQGRSPELWFSSWKTAKLRHCLMRGRSTQLRIGLINPPIVAQILDWRKAILTT